MNVVYIHFNIIFFYHLTEKIVILNGFGRSEVKKFKYVAASIFVLICCVIVIGAPKSAFAAGDNQLTVSVTDDYYSKPVDGVTITITDTATSSVVSEQITDANGRVQVTLPDGTYKVEQTKFKAGYVINHSATNVTFSGVAGGNNDHQTINIEDVHIMGKLYVDADKIVPEYAGSPSTITDIKFDIEDEYGNRIASNVPGGQSVTVPVTGSYTLIPKNYPTRYAYNSDAVMIDSVFACTPSSINGMVPLHAVTFPYDSNTRLFEETTRATVRFPTRRGNIIVRVVDQHGNPIAGATLKATVADESRSGIPSPACPPAMPSFGSPDPAYLPGTETPRAMTQTPPAPGVPYTQTGVISKDGEYYSLTTGPDGTVIIPDYLVENGSTITQLTTLDGYTIDAPNPQVGEITGSNETATVTFVNRRPELPTPEPQPEPQPEPTPGPQPQTPEKPKTPKKKKAVLPDTSDVSGITSLIVGITGTLSSLAGVSMYFNKKRF